MNGTSSIGRSPLFRMRRTESFISRRSSTAQIREHELPLEKGARGIFTPSGIFFFLVKLVVPAAYVYIILVLLRELADAFPVSFAEPIEHYLPPIARLISLMQKSSLFMELWAVIEGIFFIILKIHIYWLQGKDPLEASLSAAPMLGLEERRELWSTMMKSESEDPVGFLTGWFFDLPLEEITKYDLLDFFAWSMYEGRNQEHLTQDEQQQLTEFIDEIEWRISIHKYGVTRPSRVSYASDCSGYASSNTGGYGSGVDGYHSGYASSDAEGYAVSYSRNHRPAAPTLSDLQWSSDPNERVEPKEWFRFPESTLSEDTTYFSNLYENYMAKYEGFVAEKRQQLYEAMAEKRQQIAEAEENVVAAAYETYENAYYRAIDKGGDFDKKITAFSHATQTQLAEAWNRMCSVKERLVLATATKLSNRRKALRQQLKGYRVLLARMRSMSSAVPSKQMAGVMRKITQCHEAMESLEHSARETFASATGFARETLFPHRNEPLRYAKYSSDPLLGLSTYPLAFHILILLLTDGGLRVMMMMRGFQRKKLGQIAYYYHPGTDKSSDSGSDSGSDDDEKVPIVFCHGIGIGLMIYLPLVDGFLKSGRPIFLPEIPYVSAFRPWQSPYSILPPASVTSTLTAMLASHGHLRAMFAGHSYGTSWLSYMLKYAPTGCVAAVCFLDPICFCLHTSSLTRHFVYHRSDPGSIAYMCRTDIMINWTIQRSFPWTAISLFTEQIQSNVPCSVFLSAEDALVPAEKVEQYLKSKGAPVLVFQEAGTNHFSAEPINVTLFPGEGHGDWVEDSDKMARIAEAAEIICCKADQQTKSKDQ